VVFHNNCLVCHSLEPGQNGHGPSLAEYFKHNPSQTVDQTQQLIRNGRRRLLRRAIVNSDGCRVLGTYCGGMVSGCRGPIRTEYTIIEHPVPQRIDPLSCLNLMFSGANPTN